MARWRDGEMAGEATIEDFSVVGFYPTTANALVKRRFSSIGCSTRRCGVADLGESARGGIIECVNEVDGPRAGPSSDHSLGTEGPYFIYSLW